MLFRSCTVGVGNKDQGFGPWTGPYEDFVRDTVDYIVWGRAIVKFGADKTTFELRKPVDGNAEVKVRFAIERYSRIIRAGAPRAPVFYLSYALNL